MEVFVYVLRSISDNARYVGMATDLERRLKEHNSGRNRYTKGHMPWRIVYTEQLNSWMEARVREKFLKTSSGRKFLEDKEFQ